MELTELQQKKLREEIESFKLFNKDRMGIWALKPIIGAMRLTKGCGFIGFGVRFYENLPAEPEILGSVTFYPVQVIS